jgi:hypothetical protein
MKTLAGLGVALIFASGLFAQHNNGNFVGQPVVKGGFGNVVFPGGTSATVPGLQRFNTFVSPLGSGPRLVTPRQDSHARRPIVSPFVYSYPVFVGGGYGYGYGNGYGPADAPPADQQPPQGNMTVIYPPQPAPVIINQYGVGDPYSSTARPRMYEMPSAPPEDSTAPAPPEATRYLLAFKDHTIYSAVAYWVDGDTLHYFTSGNTHNQASLSLIDHELTVRLNRESGVEIKLPATRQ